MRYKYAASTRGFYLDGVHKTIPEDAVDITIERYNELFKKQGEGQTIVPGVDGHPINRACDNALEETIEEENRPKRCRKHRGR